MLLYNIKNVDSFITWIYRNILKLPVEYLNRTIIWKIETSSYLTKNSDYIVYHLVSRCWSRWKVSYTHSNGLSNALRRVDTFTKTCNDSERTSITINHSDSRKQKKASTCAISFLVLLSRLLICMRMYGIAYHGYTLSSKGRKWERKRNMKVT